MASRITHPKVDELFTRKGPWEKELNMLRKIALDSPLTEEFKWYQPCYTYEGKNVLILGGFKEFCTMSFFKGALLKDPEGILEKAGENTRSARIVRITDAKQVSKLAPILKQYILEAVALEKSGTKFDFESTRTTETPPEVKGLFRKDKALGAAFRALTPGRQRGYLIYFSAAKQPATRLARVEKYRRKIMAGKGMQDR
jgi:uncharacterized protein YdeI (YjbR/CyaY-like superfamily)